MQVGVGYLPSNSIKVPVMTPARQINLILMFFSLKTKAPIENDTTTPALLTVERSDIMASGSESAKK